MVKFGRGFHNRGRHIALKIRSLLTSLPQKPPEYDKVAPKIEFWIEYVLRERFVTVEELVEGVSRVAWDGCDSYASAGRFLKEFRDAPRRSEEARSFVDKLCEHTLRWFAIASVEDLEASDRCDVRADKVAIRGGESFVYAASFVGHLIEWGLLSHELVRRHLVKPLITHHYVNQDSVNVFRAGAIYRLFVAAGTTLLQGLLEPEDVQVCFETLNAQISLGGITGLSEGKLQVRRAVRSVRSHRNLTCLVSNFA